jgi:hypothetical protein
MPAASVCEVADSRAAMHHLHELEGKQGQRQHRDREWRIDVAGNVTITSDQTSAALLKMRSRPSPSQAASPQ